MAQSSVGFWPPQSALKFSPRKRPKSGFGLGPGNHTHRRLRKLTMSLPSLMGLLGVAIFIEPRQKVSNASVRQRDTGVRSTVVEVDGVPVFPNCIAARKHDVLYISISLVLRLRREHPRITSHQTLLWLFQIEKSQSKSVYRTRRCSAHAVIDHQPASFGFNWRR